MKLFLYFIRRFLLSLIVLGCTGALAAPTLLSVRSQKTHGPTGTFDLPIAMGVPITGAVTVESRTGAGHTIVFEFDTPINSIVDVQTIDGNGASIGTATPIVSGDTKLIVTLTAIPDNSRVGILLNGVNGSTDFVVAVGFLIGDTNYSASIDASDISAMRAHSGQLVTAGNFQFDVNHTGLITASDISAVKARLGFVIPVSPASLTVSFAGTGGGTITSTPAGLACSALCTRSFNINAAITLTATPAASSAFTGWSGACSGTAMTASVTLSNNTTCTATFALTGPLDNPILFVAQVPTLGDFTARLSTFGNHKTGSSEVVRGGDLMIRYGDGTVRNLTKEAGFGVDRAQVDTNPPSVGNNRPIAVREPSVHWSGTKAVFSMVIGGPRQFLRPDYFWQLYEISGLGRGQTAVITKVPNQPANYSNLSPIYGTDDRIIFTSDRPRDGQAHLYPQLDEYETAPTVTGLWSINPAVAGGDLKLLTHTPSGAFTPSIDSFGRVIFTRWDHMQQDQQADVDRANPANPTYGSFNFVDETPNSAFDHNNRTEIFPESREPTTSGLFGGYPVNGYTSNLFTPWQVNEDGTEEETLNHIGRQELTFGFIPKSFANDPNLSDGTNAAIRANTHEVGQDTGLFHLREDPTRPGTYLGIHAREFGSLTSNQIVKLTGSPSINAEAMVVSNVTARDGTAGAGQPTSPGGRYRNPLPLVSGTLVASHTTAVEPDIATYTPFRLKSLTLNTTTNLYQAGSVLTGSGITKAVTWFTPDTQDSYSGLLWELEAVEVVARSRPARLTPTLPAPESSVFSDVGVDPAAFRTWLTNNNLALIVTRNQTKRDRGDLQQPYNLRVPGGVSTVKSGAQLLPNGANAYDIANYQIFQGDLIRGFTGGPSGGGRRVIAQLLHDPVAVAKNSAYAPNPGAPASSVKIASDGSTAAFVPANRALAWQTTDPAGNAVVRERVWITTQPGEIRVCASCHGTNTQDQVGAAAPVNPPLALRNLLQAWKAAPSP